MQEYNNKTMKQIKKDLPAEIREELDEFDKKVRDYEMGLIGEIKFQKIRLQLGVYAQRQEGYQMQRIKIPYGGLNSNQLRRLADVADKYANNFLHLTTRQDVQIYYLNIKQVPNMMRELADVGITTREACGNTVRNVSACHISGVSPTESFDVTPYAEAFKDFLLRNPICQNMGRKFKVCFEGCHDTDHAGIRIHDIGFQARIKKVDGKQRRGFEIWVGGGLGASPSLGHLWTEFMPVEDMIPFSAAIIRIFDRHGERKVRMKARMKFLIRKLGMDEFRKLVEAEMAALKVDPSWNDYLNDIPEQERAPEFSHDIPAAPEGTEDDPEYKHWLATNVVPHRTDDFKMVHIRIKLGDISAENARRLAEITEVFSDSTIRISILQNFMLRWVPTSALPSLYNALKQLDLAAAGANGFEDITACPGADTCRLGITSAKGLSNKLNKNMTNGLGEYGDVTKDLKIKISGCPNSCAQHVVANIGFQGAAISHQGRSVPAEMVFLGGALKGENTTLAMPIGKVPTRNAPKLVERLLEIYKSEKNEGEEFDDVMRRLGAKELKPVLKEYGDIPSYEDDPDFYKDWGHEHEKFEVQQGVKGECAGATVEEKVPTLGEAQYHIEQAEALLSHGEFEASMNEAFLACSASAHVPLYTKLVDPFTPEQTLWEFENLLVRTGEADKKWLNIAERLADERSQEAEEEQAVEMLDIAKEFYSECEYVQEQLTAGS
ncbi:MAG: nitrite/sulfite reductase [Candidatus Dadabacteria bacterium]|nr:nitrite/sulfite reductase [Candidatus Dadabacteria bacterium]NIV42926.1 nitrite/sulfite reductase [Candidatus Dadabacteria bacterium]NIX14890.1 nitrite/sulfite reductase [Candidatus Dadabacteria bacterium]